MKKTPYRLLLALTLGLTVAAPVLAAQEFTCTTATQPITDQPFVLTCTATSSAQQYDVDASAGANGTISPSGTQARTVASGSTTTFTVTPASGYSATMGGTCGGSLSGTTYTTNAITAGCTVAATFAASGGGGGGGGSGGGGGAIDPGRWTGLWIPPTLANGSANTGGPSNPVLVVADPSGALGVGSITYVPGCINQIDPNRSTACKGAGFYGSGGTKVNLAVGRIVSVRYRSSASGAGGYYLIYNKDGAGVGYSVTTSLSTIPGDFNVAAKCQATGTLYPKVLFGVIKGVTYCTPFLPNTPYYVNIKVNSPACSGATCNFKIVENSNLQ